MTIRFNVLGYTLASIDVDLADLLGDQPARALVLDPRPPLVEAVVKGVSGWWVGRMMQR